MVNTFIIAEMEEKQNSFVVSDGKKGYVVRKADLGAITLGIGDSITIIDHPNFPGVIAALDLRGHRVFHKTREDVVDEYAKTTEMRMFLQLPLIARERIEMFSKFVENFKKCDRLYEILALSLGYRLFMETENEEEIETFAKLSFADQKMLLQNFWHPLLPQIPADTVVEFAKAYLHDAKAGISGINRADLLSSELMNMPNATAERHGKFCEPRQVYISKYCSVND